MVLHSDQVSLLRLDYLLVLFLLAEAREVEDVIPGNERHLATEVHLYLAAVDANDLASAHGIDNLTPQPVTDVFHGLVLHRSYVDQRVMEFKKPTPVAEERGCARRALARYIANEAVPLQVVTRNGDNLIHVAH